MTAPWLTPPAGALADRAAAVAAAIPALRTARLILRAPCLADFAAWEALARDPRWTGHEAETAEETWLDFCQMVAGWVLRGTGLYTVEDRATGEVVGFVPLHHEWGDPELELGWFLVPQAEGRGLAFEAASVVRDHAFGTLGLRSLVSFTGTDNARSCRLAERLGARRDPAAERAAGEPGLAVYRHLPEEGPTP